VIAQAAHGGDDCPKLLHTQPCSVDCAVTAWSAWGLCNSNTGLKDRGRNVTRANVNGGLPCPDLQELQECPEFNSCKTTSWSPWSECKTSGFKVQSLPLLMVLLTNFEHDIDAITLY
jgi:hypothetical protein